jgi:dihydroflavonol-4-reductase
MKVFVTGGNGFIGSAVVQALSRAGHEIRCLLRPTSKTERIDSVQYERVVGDVRDLTSLRRGVEGCDAIIHLASLSSWDSMDTPEMNEVNLRGTQNVLEAAKEPRARVVFVSSNTAIDGTDKPRIVDETAHFSLDQYRGLSYAKLKHQAEKLCLESNRNGVPVVIVNPAETYGPLDTELITAGTLVDFAKSNPVLVPKGGGSIAHVEDVAQGIVLALERGIPGERYSLGGDHVEWKRLAELALDALGLKTRIVTIPNGMFRSMTKAATALRVPLSYNPKIVPYATRYFYVSNRKAREQLGATFRSARDTVTPTIIWLKEAGFID